MKILYIFLLFFVIYNVDGQRRTTPKTDTAEVEKPHPPSRGRGRSRFTATPEYEQISEPTKAPTESSSRRLTSRKRVSETTERRSTRPTDKPVKTAYEVDEVVNESPIDPYKRQSKPRVLTESHFESIHAPKKKLIDPFQPISVETSPSPILEELFKTVDAPVANAADPEISSAQPETTNDISGSMEITDTTFKTNFLDISSESTKSNEITREFTKSQSITSPKPTEARRAQNGARRNNVRPRTSASDVSEEAAAQAPRSRSRVRPTRRPEDTATQASQAAVSRAAPRASRRRPETSTQVAEASKKSPSVFVAEETQAVSRLRPGKRTGPSSVPEKTIPSHPIDIPSGRNKDLNRKRPATPATTTTRSEEVPKKRTSSTFQSRNSVPSTTPFSRSRPRSKDVIPTINEFTPPTTTKGRFRARDFPPIIDEQKLEVLPLFETEPKTVRPVSKSRSRSRTRSINHNHETIQTSATENDLKFTPKAKEIPRFSVSRTQTVNVETRTETSVKRKPVTRAPIVKESVIAEVSEVTSKRTVTRRKNLGLKNTISAKLKTEKPKVTVSQVVSSSRGKKKSEVNLGEVKKGGNSEEIDDSDNYPEPFKALIQAKKNKKESRPSARLQTSVPTITTIVSTSTTASTTSVSSTTADKEDDILDNEVVPKSVSTASTTTSTTTTTASTTTSKPSTRPARKRFSLTTKYPEQISTTTTTKRPTFPPRKSSKVVRSTAQPTTTTTSSKEHRFHAKFSSTVAPSVNPSKGGRSTLPPRGLYSSRKNKEKGEVHEKSRKGSVESTVQAAQIPKSFSSQKKSSRYSSKYRNDISGRGSASRSTTTAPVYIPTIPTAAYVPTIPTLRPSRTTTEYVWSEDAIDYNWPFSRLY